MHKPFLRSNFAQFQIQRQSTCKSAYSPSLILTTLSSERFRTAWVSRFTCRHSCRCSCSLFTLCSKLGNFKHESSVVVNTRRSRSSRYLFVNLLDEGIVVIGSLLGSSQLNSYMGDFEAMRAELAATKKRADDGDALIKEILRKGTYYFCFFWC